MVVFVTFGNEFSFAHRNKIPEHNVSKFLHLTYSWRQDSDNCFQDQNSTGETSDVQNLQVVHSDKVEWCVGVIGLVFHVLQLLSIRYTQQKLSCINQNRIENWTSLNNSYRFQKCMFVESSTEYIDLHVVFTIECREVHKI